MRKIAQNVEKNYVDFYYLKIGENSTNLVTLLGSQRMCASNNVLPR
jgi:hypothetical protein